MSATTKISVHALADLKNTTDDALPNYLSSLKFTQSHTKTDVRLALGYTAVMIAGALFYYDFKFQWEASKPYTAPAVIIYFILNAAFTYWIWGVEKGVVFEGTHKSGAKIWISSRTEKHNPTYFVKARWLRKDDGKGKEVWTEKEIQAPFTRWFTSDGYFVAKPFQQWLASEVDVVGEADPENVVEDIGRGSQYEGQQQKVMNVSSGNAINVLKELKKQHGGGKKRRG